MKSMFHLVLSGVSLGIKIHPSDPNSRHLLAFDLKSCATCQSHQKDPSLFAITPMGMAGPPLVASAGRLCGTFLGKDVLADH